MRILSTFGLAALLAAPAVSAQITFGVKAGVQAATAVGSSFDGIGDIDGLEKRSRLGFAGGVTADLGLTPAIAFRPEVLYSQKGYVLDSDGSNAFTQPEGTITFQQDYLEVPLLIAYRVQTLSGLEYSVEFGPTLAYLLSSGYACDVEVPDDYCDFADAEVERDNDGLNDFDVGGAIGATVGSGPFGVGVRYTQGFGSVFESSAPVGAGDVDEPTARNSVFSATLHYKFGAR